MNIKDLSQQFHQEARRIAKRIENCLNNSSSVSTSIEEDGVRIHVWFRHEVDYNILIPWEYTKDNETINHYLDKWSEYTYDATTVNGKALLTEEFEDKILKELKK